MASVVSWLRCVGLEGEGEGSEDGMWMETGSESIYMVGEGKIGMNLTVSAYMQLDMQED